MVASETDVKITPADATRDRTVGAIILESTDAEAVSPGAGVSEIHQQNVTQIFGKGLTLQTQDSMSGAGTKEHAARLKQLTATIVAALITCAARVGGAAKVIPTVGDGVPSRRRVIANLT